MVGSNVSIPLNKKRAFRYRQAYSCILWNSINSYSHLLLEFLGSSFGNDLAPV